MTEAQNAEMRATVRVSEAAEYLQVCPQTVRNWIRSGKLEEAERDGRDLRVFLDSVEAARPVDPPRPADPTDQARLADLEAKVSELATRDAAGARVLEAIEEERDRYRADAASAKEAALRVNAAAAEMSEAVKGLLSVLELQSDALRQMLAPASLRELER